MAARVFVAVWLCLVQLSLEYIAPTTETTTTTTVSTTRAPHPCDSGQHDCGPNEDCVPIGNSNAYICECSHGYFNNGTGCEEDECVMGNNSCHEHAVCDNQPGTESHTCTCRTNYHGDGRICNRFVVVYISIVIVNPEYSDVHTNPAREAALVRYLIQMLWSIFGFISRGVGHLLVSFRIIYVREGSVVVGIEVNVTEPDVPTLDDMFMNMAELGNLTFDTNRTIVGMEAEDIDVAPEECLDGTHICSGNATCKDTYDGFICTCMEDFIGNGTHCEPDRQNPCESPVFQNGMVFEAITENSPDNTTIVANMLFAGTTVGTDRTIELSLQDSADRDWGLLIEELQQLRLSLNGKVLDRDGVSGIRDLRFVVRCKDLATDAMVDNTIIATVLDLNDNRPIFVGEPYTQEVTEDPNEYFQIPFQIPSTGDIVLKHSLDYEGFQPGEEKKYLIPIVANDLAADESLRLSSTTTVTIIVTDGDDLAVQFLPCVPQGDICTSPLYVSSVRESTEQLNQPLTFNPGPIFAIDLDRDVQGPPGIVYSFLAGFPSDFRDYFNIEGLTGNITLKKLVNRTQVEEFIITVKAEQDDNPVRYATAEVRIGVKDNDVNKPYFFIFTGESEFKGYVREVTGQAAVVMRYDESPLLLEVRDDDFADKLVPRGVLRYELTDGSGIFDVTDTGYLIVDSNQLDVDTQGQYRMTVKAVETTTFLKLSTDEVTVVVIVLNETAIHTEETLFRVYVVVGAAVGCLVAGLLLGVAATLLIPRCRSVKSADEEEYEDVRTPDRAASQRSGTGSDVYYTYPMAPLAESPPLSTQSSGHYQDLRPAVYQSLERPAVYQSLQRQ
ncbi:uncharacterized protein LOC144902350 isoform X2 [Branchiostoma floridae x Branchiostoma belcheri]